MPRGGQRGRNYSLPYYQRREERGQDRGRHRDQDRRGVAEFLNWSETNDKMVIKSKYGRINQSCDNEDQSKH